ncbi:DUF7225 domain-containing protein [Parendozoicomonas haliclonae]|uniref:DUF7225 domain-containing protein n=1 Tax=Parendozoicomonas haliclonae TaxID=1960125 RepID=A0A1X7AIT0_9GAMM|nr:hypothetical protein [Parendozoicomonas haliclonae]SMA45487.1 hypothetical protein EHSB41UT_01930 [Parendozoicomonas haliclonae]
MPINEIVEKVLRESGKLKFTRSEIIELVHRKENINKDSIIPSDYCYNRTNKGIDRGESPDRKFLEHTGLTGEYEYKGFDFPYTGFIYDKSKNTLTGCYYEGSYISQSQLEAMCK